ncbi:MAG: cupredoxin domain-containing protein [Zavarzinella sp.]|nr:cupredoxin domain-containing protein [Zavarzinella sp.]
MRLSHLFALALGTVVLLVPAPQSAQACWWGHGGGWGMGYGGGWGYGGPTYVAPAPAYYGPGPGYGPAPASPAPGPYYAPAPGPAMAPGTAVPGTMRMMPGPGGPVPMPAPSTVLTATVSALDDRFDPPTLNIRPGTTVKWTNTGSHTHTVTDRAGKFDSGDVRPGGTFTATFQTPGTYHYYCKHHKGMEGTIVVGDGGKTPGDGARPPAAGAPGPSNVPKY